MNSTAYVRLSAYYFLFFITISVFSPYFNLYLAARGLNSTEVGVILAIIPLTGVIVQPVWGLVNDLWNIQRITLCLGLVIPAGTLLLLPHLHSIPAFTLCVIGYALFQTAMMPVSDSMTVKMADIRNYGKVRLFGSLGYAVGVAVTAYLLRRFGILGLPGVYLASVGLALIGLVLIPQMHRDRENRTLVPLSNFSGVGKLIRNRRFLLLLFFTLFVTTSQAINSGFFTLYFTALHRPLSILGIIYALGALSELPCFFAAGRLIERFGAERIFLLGGGVYLIRWVVLTMEPPTWLMIVLQLSHGLSFGLSFAAGVAIARGVSDDSNRTTAQTLYSAVNTGLAAIIGSFVGGIMLDHQGPKGLYVTAAAFCLVGLVMMIVYVMAVRPNKRGVRLASHVRG